MIKQRETFHFKPSIFIKGDWMLGLTGLEVYISFFIIKDDNNKLNLYNFPDERSGGVSYEKVKDEIERDSDVSDITATDLEDDIRAPIFIKEYRDQVTKRKKDVGYMNILAGYIMSIFQDFESYLRAEVDLVEDDIRLALDGYKSSFIIQGLQPGNYSF